MARTAPSISLRKIKIVMFLELITSRSNILSSVRLLSQSTMILLRADAAFNWITGFFYKFMEQCSLQRKVWC